MLQKLLRVKSTQWDISMCVCVHMSEYDVSCYLYLSLLHLLWHRCKKTYHTECRQILSRITLLETQTLTHDWTIKDHSHSHFRHFGWSRVRTALIKLLKCFVFVFFCKLNSFPLFFCSYNRGIQSLTHPGDGQGLVEVLSSCQAKPPGGRTTQHHIDWHDPLISPCC